MTHEAYGTAVLRQGPLDDGAVEAHSTAPGGRHPRVALMCTDLEGFTTTVERLGDYHARDLMRVHNLLIRHCLRRNGGVEVAHLGDGILASFPIAREAIRCAMAIQRRLHSHNISAQDVPFRIRIGLHVGNPLPEDGRLFGSCVNATVRVCGAASPGSILVSDALRRATYCDGSANRYLSDGLYKLKGFGTPLRLHELCWK